jgi:transcriptional regulator with XRE-family HTH domain
MTTTHDVQTMGDTPVTPPAKRGDREALGQMVRDLRLALGLTQDELAVRAGMYQTHVARLESGRTEPRFETLCRIAEALGMRFVFGFERE